MIFVAHKTHAIEDIQMKPHFDIYTVKPRYNAHVRSREKRALYPGTRYNREITNTGKN